MNALIESLTAPFGRTAAQEAAGAAGTRQTALDAVLRDGLPHARRESWRYTPLRALERRRFAPADQALVAFDPALLDGIPAPRLVFVNGRFNATASDLSALADGVSLQPVSQVLSAGDDSAVHLLAGQYESPDEVFARLNTALAEEGVVVRVAAGAQAASPLHLVFVGAPAEGDRAWHLRHLVELGERAQLELVEYQLGGGEHRHLLNHLMRIRVGAGAQLGHWRVQDESHGATVVSRTDAIVETDARYRRLDLELGAALSRHELNITLSGERGQAHANGALLATGRRHLDTRLGIDHIGRDSACELVWRGLGADRARAVFHGGILIREGADGTSASLSNKNLLLSDAAEIDTQPVLVIHADEVQAAHGATVGQLDPTALFYLRSRGLPAEQARALLTAAFCRETLTVIDDATVRDALAVRLDAALARLEPA
ncbi:Fe-S cluster assembly protein SufD [Lysobacter korlensis]|uniref:Fe-S cluster assembly protein SufD n=1 Tax=Lysobacter korlensis TaxID=553636 RepID=A0ABV6RPE0_9GAMM